MSVFLEEIEIPGEATFFCTQRYVSLGSTAHETCPHVFLNPGTDWAATLAESRKVFPEAKGWRSHSCVFSHILAEQLAASGYEYVSIHDQMGRCDLEPHRHAWGLWHFPIYYMDNLDFSSPRFWGETAEAPFAPSLISNAVNVDALFVFAFHPIHLMLNSPSPESYFARRDRFEAGENAGDLRFEGYGTRTFYDELCDSLRTEGRTSTRLDCALDVYRDRQSQTTAA